MIGNVLNLPNENLTNEYDCIEMFHLNPGLIDDDQSHELNSPRIQLNSKTTRASSMFCSPQKQISILQKYISIDREIFYVYPKIHLV